jgi:hypothetical protein
VVTVNRLAARVFYLAGDALGLAHRAAIRAGDAFHAAQRRTDKVKGNR